MLVFQYGSNCLESEINGQSRLRGDAQFAGIGKVDDFELAFDVCSTNRGCAAFDIVAQAGAVVWGVLYEIPDNLIDRKASACGLTARTIQRIEAGEPSTVTTRRALARGLGYDNLDVFNDPETVLKIEQFRADLGRIGEKAIEEQFPDRVRIPAVRVRTGQQLGQLAEQSNAWAFHYDDDLNDDAKRTAAAIVDYLRDYADVDDSCSATQKLDVYKDLGIMLKDLEARGRCCPLRRALDKHRRNGLGK